MKKNFIIFNQEYYVECLTSYNILSVPRVYIVIHVPSSSIVAIAVVASVVHVHVRPRIPGLMSKYYNPTSCSQKFSLVVGVTTADVHYVTRSHVDAGLKQNS